MKNEPLILRRSVSGHFFSHAVDIGALELVYNKETESALCAVVSHTNT